MVIDFCPSYRIHEARVRIDLYCRPIIRQVIGSTKFTDKCRQWMSDLLPICSLHMVEPIGATLMRIYLRGHIVRYGHRLWPHRVSAKLAIQSFDAKHPIHSVATTNRQYHWYRAPLRSGLQSCFCSFWDYAKLLCQCLSCIFCMEFCRDICASLLGIL